MTQLPNGVSPSSRPGRAQVPNFESVAAKPSAYPPRSFCKITGLAGKYKGPVTGEYLATLAAYETHRETRLKGLI